MTGAPEPPRDGDRGSLAIVLHAHQPFVRETGGTVTAAEERFFGIVTRCYVPLISALSALVADRVPVRLALSVSPPLLDLLSDRVVQQRYVRYLDRCLTDGGRTLGASREHPVLVGHPDDERDRLRDVRRAFVETWSCDLVNALRALERAGVVEALASAATHAYLPLLASDPRSIRAQLRVGLDQHRRHFGTSALGVWLPGAAYAPGVDEILAELDVRYSVLDARGLTRARPRPVMGVWSPVISPSGVAFFGRDPEAWAQVAGEHGYPADPDYLPTEMPRDLEEPCALPLGAPQGTPYSARRARAKLDAHANNFVACRESQIDALAAMMPRPPIVLAAYAAELFGARWLEGPAWLAATLRKIAYDQRSFTLTTPSEYLARHPLAQECRVAGSSAGHRGDQASRLGGENDWVYLPLHRAGLRMRALVRQNEDATGLRLRALNQAARELLLAQSGDWPLRMSKGVLVNDAVRRTRLHLARFARLARDLEDGSPDEAWLADVEARDNAFPALDYRSLG